MLLHLSNEFPLQTKMVSKSEKVFWQKMVVIIDNEYLTNTVDFIHFKIFLTT